LSKKFEDIKGVIRNRISTDR